MKKVIRKFLRLITPKPKRELEWSVRDYNIAKSYAKVIDNPKNPNLSLWDTMKNPWYDSVDLLNEVNKIIRNPSQK